MGRIPAIVVVVIAIWIGHTLYRQGPERAFGGVFSLLSSPQYGEEDRPTRSGNLADKAQAPPQPEEANESWWSQP